MTLRSVTTGLVATAMLAGAVTPAMAHDGYGYGYGNRGYGGYDRYRHNRSSDAGAIIAGVAVVGIIAAIAASAAKAKSQNGYAQRGGWIGTERDAADACTLSAEQRYGSGARVSRIDDVYRTRDGYEVQGTIDTRGYRYDRGQPFTCSVRYGQIARVDFVGDRGGY